MNLVVGATGNLGGEICRQLAAQGRPLRALVRRTSDPAKIEQLRGLGAEIEEGDLRDRTSLNRVCAGAAAVVSTATTILSRQEGETFESTDEQGQIQLVEAAEAAGVERFVFLSFSELPLDFPLQRAKRAVEARLHAGRLAWTILRPGLFMETWLSQVMGFDLAAGTARILGSGDGRVNWVAVPDVAAVAVAALEDERGRNATIAFGSDYRSANDIVGLVRETSGRELAVERVPQRALEEQLAGAPDPVQQSFAALMLSTARGDREDRSAELRRWVERPISLQDFLSATAA